jgi:hypothetical protein
MALMFVQVLVMDHGILAETGTPHDLLLIPSGIFASMAAASRTGLFTSIAMASRSAGPHQRPDATADLNTTIVVDV